MELTDVSKTAIVTLRCHAKAELFCIIVDGNGIVRNAELDFGSNLSLQ
jgi:hypothetical protein